MLYEIIMYHFVRTLKLNSEIFSLVNVLVRRLSTIHSPLSLVTQFKNLMGGILESASPTTFFFFNFPMRFNAAHNSWPHLLSQSSTGF